MRYLNDHWTKEIHLLVLHEIREQVRWYYKQADQEKAAIKALGEAGLHTISNLIDTAATWLLPVKRFFESGPTLE